MSAKTDSDYLRDMLQYAEEAQALVSGRAAEDLMADRALRYALQYCLLVIGEAASRISETTREKIPNIPWRQVVGMRNWLAHGYSVIRTETLWETATKDLPALTEDILGFLPPEQT